MIDPDLANYIGFVGMACILAAYAYQTANNRPNPFIQHGANLIGAVLLVISLTVHHNAPSMVLEACWVVIAVFGLVRAWQARGKVKA
ncbi:hypothetical protein GCM10009127_17260 [Alteraurantiacibacter aestuarii]|uniref:Permease n=1 Tax=Alteraurantiacibacter aestuarii TaxID=650004 RepID=A0A844ZIS4_9SPHN|nr:permease [Alteraurantiacibacter aestuarii]MXO87688.1 permease [Alteraurantiacibacter aestuarii]